MPLYLYRHPTTGEIREIVQTIKEEHKYVDENGLEWAREFTVPNASIDTKWDPNSAKDFVRKTASKKGTIGDLLDKSAELSKKREEKIGKDPLKENMYKDYSKKRNGAIHPKQRKEQFEKKKKELEKKGFKISL